ncbi:MAG: O-antigen ligase family protein [Desulfotomaculales bacterium]
MKESLTWRAGEYARVLWRESALYALLNGDWAAKSAFGRAVASFLDRLERYSAAKEVAAGPGRLLRQAAAATGEILFPLVLLILPFVRFRTVLALIVLSVVLVLTQKRNLRWPRTGAFVPIVLFLLIQFYAAASSVSFFTSASDFLIAAACFLYLFALAGGVDKPGQLDNLLRALGLSAFLMAGYAVYVYYTGTSVTELGKIWIDPNTNPDVKNRAYAVFDNPNLLAHYVVLTFPLLLGALFNARRLTERVFFLAAAALSGLCLVLTFSRGGWLGFAAAVFVFAVVRSRFLLFALPPAGAVLYNLLPPAVLQRLANIANLKDASYVYRLDVWNSTLDLIRDYWLTGVGLGWRAFTRVYYTYMRNSAVIPHAHNLFLQLQSELGVLGPAVFIWLLVYFFRLGWSLRRHPQNYVRNLNAGVCGALAGFFVHSLFDYTLWHYVLAVLFWVLPSILLLLVKFQQREDEQVEGKV